MVSPVVGPVGLLLRDGRRNGFYERGHILSAPLARPVGGGPPLEDLRDHGVPGHVVGGLGVVHGGMVLTRDCGVLVVIRRLQFGVRVSVDL